MIEPDIPDPITESDLLAFVDGRLGPDRRNEVEDYLVQFPDDAYRIAADLALLAGLRRLFGRPVAMSLLYTSFLA